MNLSEHVGKSHYPQKMKNDYPNDGFPGFSNCQVKIETVNNFQCWAWVAS